MSSLTRSKCVDNNANGHDVLYLMAKSADTGLTAPLAYNGTVAAGKQTGFANPLVAAPSTGLTLPSGDTIIVYITSPDSVTITTSA